MTISKILVLISLVLFIVAAFGIGNVGPVQTVPLGLAVFVGSFLTP